MSIELVHADQPANIFTIYPIQSDQSVRTKTDSPTSTDNSVAAFPFLRAISKYPWLPIKETNFGDNLDPKPLAKFMLNYSIFVSLI